MSQEQSLHDPANHLFDGLLDDLVRQAQQASPDERRQILDQLVNQFAEAAFRWAVMILEDSNAASDALQEAWLNAYLHLDQLREGAAFPSWFRQLVLSACYHAIRHEKRARTIDHEPPEALPAQSDPLQEVEDQERLEHIREAILALPERERVVTELYYFDDYPQQEIAEVLSVPVTTVKKRLQYAREHLKGLIHADIVSQLAPLGQFDRVDSYALNGGCTASAVSKAFGRPVLTTSVIDVVEWSPVSSKLSAFSVAIMAR